MAQKVKPLCGDLHAITLQFEAAAATGGTAQLAFIDHEERVLADGPAAPAALPQVGGKAQGPGQTQAYASIWETTYKISNSLNVGLAFAAVGFLVAGLVGVPLAFYGIKKGWVSIEGGKLPQCFLRGLMDKGDNPTCARSTTHPANIDSVAFHLAIMATLYALAYAFGVWWLCTMPKGINGLGIGMIFAWGMFFAMIARKLMAKFDLIHLLDGETTRRLTGATVAAPSRSWTRMCSPCRRGMLSAARRRR